MKIAYSLIALTLWSGSLYAQTTTGTGAANSGGVSNQGLTGSAVQPSPPPIPIPSTRRNGQLSPPSSATHSGNAGAAGSLGSSGSSCTPDSFGLLPKDCAIPPGGAPSNSGSSGNSESSSTLGFPQPRTDQQSGQLSGTTSTPGVGTGTGNTTSNSGDNTSPLDSDPSRR